jgi:hypothetical protein
MNANEMTSTSTLSPPPSPRTRLSLIAHLGVEGARAWELESAIARCAARSRQQLEGSIVLEPCVGRPDDERFAATINGVAKQQCSRPKGKRRKAA